MIYLHTGAPGNGKTLLTIDMIRKEVEKDGRAVYYHGIKDLKLPWLELDSPDQWTGVPDGSIVVIDECQSTWRPRAYGSQVPESVSAMETHRHRGIDIYLITQHPMLLDSNIRRLVGKHRHIVRAFGMQAANVHEWEQVRDQPDKSRAGSVETKVLYPKDVYNLYHSATVHTHKARIPARVWFLLSLPILLGALVWFLIQWMHQRADTKKAEDKAKAMEVQKDGTSKPAAGMNYYEARTPRVVGLAYTAPVYDDITKPVRAPYPAVCYVVGYKGQSDCRCRTQQNTPYEMPDGLCRKISKEGMFFDWDTRGLPLADERKRDQQEPRRREPVQAQAQPQPVVDHTNRPPVPPSAPVQQDRAPVTPDQAAAFVDRRDAVVWTEPRRGEWESWPPKS